MIEWSCASKKCSENLPFCSVSQSKGALENALSSSLDPKPAARERQRERESCEGGCEAGKLCARVSERDLSEQTL
jgi:hypothetical protein